MLMEVKLNFFKLKVNIKNKIQNSLKYVVLIYFKFKVIGIIII
jgi:hypothetical protein